MRNRTAIEDWILEKAKYRREGTEHEFPFPYDLGIMKNIGQVASWSCAAVGDGINWKVRDGCDQYTLTVKPLPHLKHFINRQPLTFFPHSTPLPFQIEQIEQKAEKRARTRTYTIIRRATGSWLPLWSQGFAVCLHPPCTDESRIRLEVNDVVKVTRWKK